MVQQQFVISRNLRHGDAAIGKQLRCPIQVVSCKPKPIRPLSGGQANGAKYIEDVRVACGSQKFDHQVRLIECIAGAVDQGTEPAFVKTVVGQEIDVVVYELVDQVDVIAQDARLFCNARSASRIRIGKSFDLLLRNVDPRGRFSPGKDFFGFVWMNRFFDLEERRTSWG